MTRKATAEVEAYKPDMLDYTLHTCAGLECYCKGSKACAGGHRPFRESDVLVRCGTCGLVLELTPPPRS